MPKKYSLLSAGLLIAGMAWAEPAPWYWWVSRIDGGRVCHQTSLGPGWVQAPTAFRDARCRVRLDPR